MNDVTIIDRFLDTFSRYIDSGFGLLHGEVAFLTATLIVIDMTIAGLLWAMGHATGQGEDVIAKLIRKVLYVGAFAYIIGNFNWLAGIVFRSFASLGLTARLDLEHGEFPATGQAGQGRHRRRGADPQTDRRHGGIPRGVREHHAHRRDVPRVADRPAVLLRAGDPAFITLIEFADDAGGLRSGAVRALEQDRVPH